MEEHWKDIDGYEGLYQVSDWGNVRSLNYRHTGKEHLLKPIKFGDYLGVCLCKDGEIKKEKVHRLVAEAFIPNPNHLPEVNHKSECRMLNFACVLEWTTHKENTNYGTGTQRMADSHSKPVDQHDRDGNFICRWKSATEVERQLGISKQNICLCLRGKQNTAGGFVWHYAEE